MCDLLGESAYSDESISLFRAKVTGHSERSRHPVPKQAASRSVATRVIWLCILLVSVGQALSFLSHGFSFQIDLVSIVNEPVKDGVSEK